MSQVNPRKARTTMNEQRKQRKQRTITLTDRSPVKIYEDEWPVLAHAEWWDFDNQYEFQANRKAEVHIRVRQHANDGRHIVYGTYRYTTQFQNEYDCRTAAGKLLDGGWNETAIVEAIHAVTDSLSSYESLPDSWQPDWRKLADDCIADLPAEEL